MQVFPKYFTYYVYHNRLAECPTIKITSLQLKNKKIDVNKKFMMTAYDPDRPTEAPTFAASVEAFLISPIIELYDFLQTMVRFFD